MEEKKPTKKRTIKKKDITPVINDETTTEVTTITIEEKIEISPLLKEADPEEIIIEESKRKFRFINATHEFRTIEMAIIVSLVMFIGICLGGLTVGLNTKEDVIVNNITATADKEFNKLVTTYNNIIENYIEDVDKEELIDGAINGMLKTIGDPYTSYLDADETSSFYKRLQGTFYGIGCEIVKNGTNIYVTGVINGSPAKAAGVKVGDIITKVDAGSTEGLTAAETVDLISNSTSNDVTLTIIRDEKTKTIKIAKAQVTIESVHPETYNKNNKKIGYIKIDIFAANTYTQFREAVIELENKNIDSLIIDVRDNTGGYLDAAHNMLSMFFSKDKVIYQFKANDQITKVYSSTAEKRTYEVVILQNIYSASASEILAGAFKEAYGSEVIGTASYGKSSVQETSDLGDGTMIKYTVKKWLTAGGNDVGGKGVIPTIELEQGAAYAADSTAANDTQLQKALSILTD